MLKANQCLDNKLRNLHWDICTSEATKAVESNGTWVCGVGELVALQTLVWPVV